MSEHWFWTHALSTACAADTQWFRRLFASAAPPAPWSLQWLTTDDLTQVCDKWFCALQSAWWTCRGVSVMVGGAKTLARAETRQHTIPNRWPVNTFTRALYVLQFQQLVYSWRFVPFPMMEKDAKLHILAVDHSCNFECQALFFTYIDDVTCKKTMTS